MVVTTILFIFSMHLEELSRQFLMLYILFGQVAAVIFTEDLKRLYVTMKEGFLLDYW